MAGPYYVRLQSAAETVLDRNPNYTGKRPRRPGRIVYDTGVPTAQSVELANGGKIDLVTYDYDPHGPLEPGGAVDQSYGKGSPNPRYRAAQAPGVDMIAFNTKRPPFSDVRMRRAASFAIDRRALAAVFSEGITDRYVPPVISRSATGQAYPLDPDLTKARQLAGTRTARKATVYACGDPSNIRIAGILRENLARIGIDLSVINTDDCLRGPDPKAARSDILLVTRATPELDPAPFVEATLGKTEVFGPSPLPVTWDDAEFDKRLEDARLLSGAARRASYAQIEDDMLRGPAPYAAFGSFVAPEFYSARSGCRVVQGAYGYVDLGAMCVRGS
jgi:peptide/nickel transport system substrate-binding protein